MIYAVLLLELSATAKLKHWKAWVVVLVLTKRFKKHSFLVDKYSDFDVTITSPCSGYFFATHLDSQTEIILVQNFDSEMNEWMNEWKMIGASLNRMPYVAKLNMSVQFIHSYGAVYFGTLSKEINKMSERNHML